jgi:hypothetical protein
MRMKNPKLTPALSHRSPSHEFFPPQLQSTHIPLLRPTNKDIGQYQLPGRLGHHMNAEVKGKCKNISLKIHGS